MEMSDKWYACYCEPSKAMDLVRALAAEGKDVSCPWFEYRRRVPRQNRVEILKKPLIGGVFFCRTDSWPLGEGSVAGVDLPSVSRMLSFGKVGEVSGEELDEFCLAGAQDGNTRTKFLKGDSVTARSGPFKGFKGEVISESGGYVNVLLEGFPMSFKISPFLIGKTQA